MVYQIVHLVISLLFRDIEDILLKLIQTIFIKRKAKYYMNPETIY